MPFVKFGEAAIQIYVCRVLRAVVAVVVGRSVKALAVGVVPKHGEMIAETFLDLQDSALVNSVSLGAVLVILNHQRIHKTIGRGGTGQALRPAKRVGRRTCIPVAI